MQRKTLESTRYEGLKNATHIDVEVCYSRDSAQRGYYLRVTPVTHKDGIVSYTLFSGVRKLLLPTSRFSNKQFEQAVELGRNEAPALIAQLLEQERAA